MCQSVGRNRTQRQGPTDPQDDGEGAPVAATELTRTHRILIGVVVAGAVLWAVGLLFEAIGDAQLAAYRQIPKDDRPPVGGLAVVAALDASAATAALTVPEAVSALRGLRAGGSPGPAH